MNRNVTTSRRPVCESPLANLNVFVMGLCAAVITFTGSDWLNADEPARAVEPAAHSSRRMYREMPRILDSSDREPSSSAVNVTITDDRLDYAEARLEHPERQTIDPKSPRQLDIDSIISRPINPKPTPSIEPETPPLPEATKIAVVPIGGDEVPQVLATHSDAVATLGTKIFALRNQPHTYPVVPAKITIGFATAPRPARQIHQPKPINSVEPVTRIKVLSSESIPASSTAGKGNRQETAE